MNSLKKQIGGVIVPAITAVVENGRGGYEIDEMSSDNLIDEYIGNGVGTIFLFGYAGGCHRGLSLTQRKAHLEQVIEYVDNRVPVVVGIAHENLNTAIKLAKHAKDVHADAIVLLLNQLYENYETQVNEILEATEQIPLILYNNPGVGQKKCLQPQELLKYIEGHPKRIMGLKESSGDEKTFISFVKLQRELSEKNMPLLLFMGDANKIPWVLKNQEELGFRLPGVVPVEANIPERLALYVKQFNGEFPEGIFYLTIPETISYLIDHGKINKASLSFWNGLPR